jgi:myxalamid-type nonribosomal peptide synthetase MxaA
VTNPPLEKRLKELSASKARLLELLIERRATDRHQYIEPCHRIADASGAVRCPTSWAQQRLWFIDQLEEGSTAYNVPVALRFRGHLCLESLRGAFDALVDRHETLRTVFLNVTGEPVQEIRPRGRVELTVSDLSIVPRHEREQQLLACRNAEGRLRFRLDSGPLMRVHLLRLDVDEHVLLITMHHIVADGWSLGVMLPELAELYSAHRERRKPSLAPLQIQYADYAQWQREWLRGTALEQQFSYWRSHLEGAPPELALPLDRPRPALQAYRGENVSVVIVPELSAGLRALAQRHGMTLFMILFAAWAILLSRLAGTADLVIGTPVANRRRAELEGLIGFFVNTLALRLHVDRQGSLVDFLKHVKGVMLGAYEHQDVPFEQLVETLNPGRALNRHPIFQVLFVLQNAPLGTPNFSGLRVSREEEVNSTSKFDLVLMMEERGDRLAGILNYDTDLFDRGTVQRWLNSFIVLLRSMLGDTGARIADLALLSASESAQIERFNATRVDYPLRRCVHELFEEQAALTPGATAVLHGQDSITYAELNERAERLADFLREQGVYADQPVGLCINRSFEMIVGLLAILKAGGAYLPLDPHYPPERLQYMLDDARPRVVLTRRSLQAVVPETSAEIIFIDALSRQAPAVGTLPRGRVTHQPMPHNLLYVIYTSGSTGKPKGTAMPHSAMVNLIEWHRECLPLRAGQRVLQFAALSFDVAFQEVFSTLCLGGTLVLVAEEVRRDASALAELLTSARVERLFLPPLMLQSLAEHFCASGKSPQYLVDVITAGEQLRISPEIVGLFRALPHCRLHNHYGPTETHVVTTLTLASEPTAWPEFPSIGAPIANTQIHILDEACRPVPIGVAGELYIGGTNVARCYLHREELTAARFVRDPFSAQSDARMYRTGDLGRWCADGTIEYLGRNDDQVKIRGYRIELGEVEAQLARHPRVKEAAVIARESTSGVKTLVAYFTQRDHATPSADELRLHLKKVLPEYMVPSAFVLLEQLPLTPSGKLNRRALPAPVLTSFATQQHEAPASETEQAIAEIWQRLLGVERVGRDNSFFDLGGHSLLALKALFEINRSLGKALKVSDIYRSATVRDLALRLSAHDERTDFVELSQEATLEPIVAAPGGAPRAPANGVLLTGGTGFVGRFLLAQLLQDRDASIYCLVRARTPGDAQRRVKAVLEEWGLWRDGFERRVVAIPGDLRQPRLGIDERSWRELGCKVGSIFHCGTSMNHLEPYAMAKPANVDSVRELLRLATEGAPKQFNLVSTLGIFNAAPAGTRRVVDESSPIDHERHPAAHGYVASKWVGEKLAMLAMTRGLPCNILRLGLVWADSRQGRYDELQRVYRIFKSALLTGLGIQRYEQYETPPVPVDHVARAIVYLADRYKEGQRIFHLCSSADRSNGWFECCNDSGIATLELVPFYEWTRQIKRFHEAGVSLPVVPLLEETFAMDEASFYEHLRTFRAGLTIEADQTTDVLRRAAITMPPLSGELVRACFTTMLARDPDLQELPEVSAGAQLIPSASPANDAAMRRLVN